ncbi:hypothetical protein ACVWXN_004235 [Bradyrhizobium sp. i1.4.4]
MASVVPGVRASEPSRFELGSHRLGQACWIEADPKPKEVQTFAGEGSLQVTVDRYGHLFKSDDRESRWMRLPLTCSRKEA